MSIPDIFRAMPNQTGVAKVVIKRNPNLEERDQSVADWAKWGQKEWVSEEEKRKAIKLDTVWEASILSPGWFRIFYGSTAEAVLEAAYAAKTR